MSRVLKQSLGAGADFPALGDGRPASAVSHQDKRRAWRRRTRGPGLSR
jgi:hypothetical protein